MIEQLYALFLFALVVACISWTVTHEDIFREPRDWLAEKSRSASSVLVRKFCYVFTCEYCFSHYVSAAAVAVFDFWLVLPDWRGFFVGWLGLVAVANVYMSLYAHLRVETNKERAEMKTIHKRFLDEGGDGRAPERHSGPQLERAE